VRRQPRAFALEELWVRERRGAAESVAQVRRQLGDGDLDSSGQADLDRTRGSLRGQLTWVYARARGRAIGEAERPAGTLGVGRDLLGLLAAQSLNTGEVDPLIPARLEILAEEQCAAFGAAGVLQRQRDQVAEPACRHRVLVGKQPVIGGHRYRPTAHRARQQQRPDGARHSSGHRSREQHPQVRARSRA